MKSVILSGDICRFLDENDQDSFRANITFDAKTSVTSGELDHLDRVELAQLLEAALVRVLSKREKTDDAWAKQQTDAAELRAAVKALNKITPSRHK